MRKKQTEKNKNYLAAIDIGTNSFHLVIVEILADGNVKILDRAKENARLGSGGKDMKTITPEAMERGITALKHFAEIAHTYQAPIRAVATSAVREALNQNNFLKKVHARTGITVEVVSGFEEARLIYLGVLQALPVFEKRVLCIDIGGGSVEYLIGTKGEALYANSLKIGCIRLTERFFSRSILKDKDIKACREHIVGFISPVAREIKKYRYEFAIGSSGTIQNIANMIRAMRGEIISMQVNNFSFTKDELNKIVKTLLRARTDGQRAQIPGLDPKRVDIIVAGALVLQESFNLLKIKRLTVSEFALREGIIYDYLKNRLYELDHHHHLSNIRYKSVMQLAKTFNYDTHHANQAVKLSLSIFDQTKNLHKLGEREREFLEYAALLHEIGFFISHAQHHRHTYYLIRNSELAGFTDTEKEIIANIARYHRKSHPKPKHDGYNYLTENERVIVKKLAGILRLADGLDRSHISKVSSVKCRVQPRSFILKIKSSSKIDLEEWAVNMKKGLFEEVFHKPVVLKRA
ncbi:Ppx/GppA family phosphatase [bacterium]|nr:MAG: Ppx/GppA family phosphatase [bacterium]MBL7958660.1 Ppx/GppA family phosphatase [bacterium]